MPDFEAYPRLPREVIDDPNMQADTIRRLLTTARSVRNEVYFATLRGMRPEQALFFGTMTIQEHIASLKEYVDEISRDHGRYPTMQTGDKRFHQLHLVACDASLHLIGGTYNPDFGVIVLDEIGDQPLIHMSPVPESLPDMLQRIPMVPADELYRQP